MVYAKLKRYQEAFSTFEQLLGQSQLNDDRTPITRALLCAMSGQVDEACNQLSQLEREKTNRYSHALKFINAAVHANLGEIEQALDLLEKCYAERLPSLTFLAGQPEFVKLHNHPRFVDLVHRIGLSEGAV